MSGPNSLTGIDTNVLIRALVGDDERQSPVAQRTLEALTPDDPGLVTQVTLVETYWLLRRTYGFDRDACLGIVHALLETDSLEFDDAESVVRALALAGDGADFADALIQSTMELFGASTTVTFDQRAADRLGWTLLDQASR